MPTESTNFHGVRRRLGGFTLIELLLAIGIMATILAAMSSVLWIAVRMNNGVTDTVEEGLPAEQALIGIQRDLANLICSTNSMADTNGYSTGLLIGPFQTITRPTRCPTRSWAAQISTPPGGSQTGWFPGGTSRR